MNERQYPEILIVEDDEAIAAGLALNLKLEGYASKIVHDGQEAVSAIDELGPDLVLLDISLPRKNGLDLLREVRATGNRVPVIVLSAREGEYDKVAALRLGADDYVTKPFALAELMARVQAVLRRSQPSPEEERVVRFSDVEVSFAERMVSRAGNPVRLTHLEFELLGFLLDHPNRVFSREELLKEVWGVQHNGSRRTVDNFVAQLRAKLESDPENPQYFITVRGTGYRFNGS
ncbi:MAG: response regulator transcription factor [Myxococcales bacterium]|nr:response regulator transcription factor [Myxococcales bacterium]